METCYQHDVPSTNSLWPSIAKPTKAEETDSKDDKHGVDENFGKT